MWVFWSQLITCSKPIGTLSHPLAHAIWCHFVCFFILSWWSLGDTGAWFGFSTAEAVDQGCYLSVLFQLSAQFFDLFILRQQVCFMLFTYQLQWGYLEEGKLGLRIYPINFNIQKSIHILKYLVPGIFSLDVHIHEYFFWIYPFERKTFHISWILKNCFLVYKAFPINYGLLGLPQLPITYSWNRFLLWFPSYLLLTLFFVVPFPYLLTVESFLITFPQLSYLFLGPPPQL